jgi:hypothetical protein
VVLASGILCQEHHTPDNMQADVDFMVGLEADLVQFMLLTPMPTTALYREFEEQGWLRTDLPYEEWHGQKHLAFHHPAFPGDSAERCITAAFRQDYEVNGSSMLRVVDTALRGYRRLANLPRRDACQELRMRELREQTREWAALLPTIAANAVNGLERRRALDLDRQVAAALGAPSAWEKVRRVGAGVFAAAWRLRLRLRGDGVQPATIVTRFGAGAAGVPAVALRRAEEPVEEWRVAAAE